MRKIFTLITLLVFTTNYATDRLVNPTLSSGNGTTIFTTITAAINAAVNGDRIIIASNTYNEAALTIGKSLQIMPQTPGTTINFNANITIAGFAGMKLEISGFNLGIYSFNSNSITNGSYTNRARISIIDSLADNFFCDNNFYECYIINNIFSKGIIFKRGYIIKNNCNQISLLDEEQNNLDTTEKNIISNNQVSFLIGIYNNDFSFIISNNKFRDLSIRRWNVSNNATNKIINNEILDDSTIHFSINDVPRYNLIFSNNKFNGNYFMGTYGNLSAHYTYSYNVPSGAGSLGLSYDAWLPTWGWCCNGPYGWYYLNGNNNPTRPPDFFSNKWISNGSDKFPNNQVAGFIEWSFNGVDLNCIIPLSNQPLALTKIIGSTNPIDGGKPSHEYYDLDLTINDRGINGGPYSQLNYNAPNPNNSKAFIFDLDMPTDLFPTQTVDIKAKGYHKN